ncbi:MAG: cation:proton antiporter [Alphaproteobacteria bacterium]|nr:cation:proton antiporter [Alphaproteobacteria bacterium]MCB9930978.1 cation:proton antiporter [Alphaproteobacteria bacterium]
MTIVAYGLLVLIGLLALAAAAVPLARKLRLPATVLFAASGLAIGLVALERGSALFGEGLDAYDRWVFAQLMLDSQSMLYVFLPPLLFEMTLAVNVRRLLDDTAVVMVMAILAVVTATVLIGVSVWVATPTALVACLLLGSAVATTDPAAVISTFREIGAPRRLLVILEGESLLNDAAAIAIFGLMIGLLSGTTEPSAGQVVSGFLYSFGAGAGLGLAAALVAGRIYPLLAGSSAAEASVTLFVAYGSFIGAEQFVGGSGVVAVVFAGLATGSIGFLWMGPGNWQTVRVVWSQIGFWANALILIIAASLVPSVISHVGWIVAPLTALVYVCALLARAVIFVAVLPVLARLNLATPLTARQSALLIWGGVRGSVTLVLALSIADRGVLGEDARLLGAVAAAYTLATIFLNAGSLAWVTHRLGLDRLSAADLALREKIIAGALERVRAVVTNIVRARDLEPEALATVDRALGERREQAEAQAAGERISFGERLRLGLTITGGQEARLIRRAFDEGAIGPRSAVALRLNAERIADAARIQGREGYDTAAAAAIRAPDGYRLAVLTRRFLKLDWPLRRAIEMHFIALLETERIVRELRTFIGQVVAPMIGQDAADNLSHLMTDRHDAVNAEIDAIAAQYPHYASAVERILVARAAIRRERQQYTRLLNDGIIGQELHDNLIGDLDRRERAVAAPPRLDLTLRPRALLDRVPIFQGLSDGQLKLIARLLRTRFTKPDEVLLQADQRGTEMYFIASGAVALEFPDGDQRLGSGDFFGGIALVQPFRRRTSKVVSLGYCRLLVLKRQDFLKLSKRDPALAEMIRTAAERQLVAGPTLRD